MPEDTRSKPKSNAKCRCRTASGVCARSAYAQAMLYAEDQSFGRIPRQRMKTSIAAAYSRWNTFANPSLSSSSYEGGPA